MFLMFYQKLQNLLRQHMLAKLHGVYFMRNDARLEYER